MDYFEDAVYDYDDYVGVYSAPEFLNVFRNVRILSDVVPYWCQIVLTLSLAIERYIYFDCERRRR